MTHEHNKSSKVLCELVNFCFINKVNNLEIFLDYEDKGFTIKLKGKCNEKPKNLNKLNDMINSPRQKEYEEYYWGLLGVDDHKQELYLLGSLVDSGEIKYYNNTIEIRLERHS